MAEDLMSPDKRRRETSDSAGEGIEDEIHCALCGYHGPRHEGASLSTPPNWDVLLGEALRSAESECPTCQGGTVDPWELIRSIRSLLEGL